MSRDFLTDRSSSWGESLKAYERQKKTLSWDREEFVPAPRLSSYDIAIKQREVDPVTMAFRNTAREEERMRTLSISSSAFHRVFGREAGFDTAENVESLRSKIEENWIEHFALLSTRFRMPARQSWSFREFASNGCARKNKNKKENGEQKK